MDICVEAILYEQKSVFIQMLELYQYDFSEFSDDDINEYGYFGYAHIDDYWKEEGRHLFYHGKWKTCRTGLSTFLL